MSRSGTERAPASALPVLLLIACGNDLRRDDGAGACLADLLQHSAPPDRLTVRRLDLVQLLPELALEISRPEVAALVFADARVAAAATASPQIRVQAISADNSSPALGHLLTPQTLLLYARQLYAKQPPAWLVTVPGADFDHGQGLSATAQQALSAGQAQISTLWGQILDAMSNYGQPV